MNTKSFIKCQDVLEFGISLQLTTGIAICTLTCKMSWSAGNSGGRGGPLNWLDKLLGKVREDGEAQPFYTEREND